MILAGIENNEYVFKNSYGKENTTDALKKEFVRVPVGSPAFSHRIVYVLNRSKIDILNLLYYCIMYHKTQKSGPSSNVLAVVNGLFDIIITSRTT